MNTAIARITPVCQADNDVENINDLVTELKDIRENVPADDICEFKTGLRTEVFITEEQQILLHDDKVMSRDFETVESDPLEGQDQHLTKRNPGKQDGIFPCVQCEYIASRKGNLKRHIETKHQCIKFYCDQCQYSTPRKDKLKEHKDTKHNLENSIDGYSYPYLYDSNITKENFCQGENSNISSVRNLKSKPVDFGVNGDSQPLQPACFPSTRSDNNSANNDDKAAKWKQDELVADANRAGKGRDPLEPRNGTTYSPVMQDNAQNIRKELENLKEEDEYEPMEPECLVKEESDDTAIKEEPSESEENESHDSKTDIKEPAENTSEINHVPLEPECIVSDGFEPTVKVEVDGADQESVVRIRFLAKFCIQGSVT